VGEVQKTPAGIVERFAFSGKSAVFHEFHAESKGMMRSAPALIPAEAGDSE
jgi:hypothetical protein